MAPKGADVAPIGSLKWWTTSKGAKTIQGTLASVVIWLGYEGHLFLEDYRATQKAVAVMNADLITIVKDHAADRKTYIEIVDKFNRGMEQHAIILNSMSKNDFQQTALLDEILNRLKGQN